MTDSSINLSVGQMLASGVFNADGTTPIYSAGAWALKNASGVTTYSVSDGGVAAIGIPVNLNYTAPPHRITGGLCCQTPGTPAVADAGQMSVGSNCYFAGRILRWSDGTSNAFSGAGIVFSNRPDATSLTLSFVANSAADSATTNGTVVGGYTSAGAWTFGVAGKQLFTSSASSEGNSAHVSGVGPGITNSTITLTAGQSTTISLTAGVPATWMVMISTANNGGTFCMAYGSSTVGELFDPEGNFAVSDTGVLLAVYKAANSYAFTLKNRSAGTYTGLGIFVIGAVISSISNPA